VLDGLVGASVAGNVSIETDAADNWKPSKKKSIERIDGIVALIMAVDPASAQPLRPVNPYQYRAFLTT
jgi:phage terminase large subunit-like protein